MIRVRPTRRLLTITAAALAVPLLVLWISVASSSRDVGATVVFPALAVGLGGWELTRQGGPKRKDLLVMILGLAGLSFIVVVGYFVSGN